MSYNKKASLKIGLYLQTDELYGDTKTFDKAMDIVRSSDIDILVLPEISYVPFEYEYRNADFLNVTEVEELYDKARELSRDIGCAVVICNKDSFGTIMSIYANAFASEEETEYKDYIKHTMTDYSAVEIRNYRECADEIFKPVFYKGYKIGMTICYDCNHSIFSRKYGLNDVDVILNCTGGDVVYDKWYKYNKVRAIENNCFSFVTMGGNGYAKNPHCYAYGFTPMGKEMHPVLLNGNDRERHNIPGGIYVYDTAEYDGTYEADISVDQKESANLKKNIEIAVSGVMDFYNSGAELENNIRILKYKENNIVMILIEGMDIMKPEIVLKLLYSERLKPIKNKRYIIINKWDNVDMDFYRSRLSVVLKVRSMENYCAVILASDNISKCFQCGNNRTSQTVKAEKGCYGIDLSRTGGPEVIWRNKLGMKKIWRENIEWLIQTM